MKRLKIDILGIIEMRWNGQGDYISEDYRVIYSGGDNGRNGVGIILNKKWAQCLRSYITYNDRLIMIKLKYVPNDIAIIQAYMPTTQANDEEEEIYEKIEELISLTNSKENLIIMGDWNAMVGENTDGREVGKYGFGTRNERGDVEFCRQHDLILTNTLFMNHKRRCYTFKMPGDINRYQLDYIMVKNRYKNQIKSSKSYPGVDIDSDHNRVMMKSVLKFKKLERPENKGPDWNLCQLKQPEIRKLFGKKCKEKLDTKGNPKTDDCNNIEHGWRCIKESIIQFAEEVLIREKLASKREWITMEIVQDIGRRRLLINKIDEESKKQYKTLRNKINREAKKAGDVDRKEL